jgi:diguanylate cyclase (GGDEF)-like protein
MYEFTPYRQAVQHLEMSAVHFRRLSHLDALTGLGNRKQFDEGLSEALAFSSTQSPVALIVFDVNKMKEINDLFGHPAGDSALRDVADAIRHSIRSSDLAARIGGDEFAVILPAGGLPGALRIAEKIQRRLNGVYVDDLQTFALSVSVGAAEWGDNLRSAEELLAEADA